MRMLFTIVGVIFATVLVIVVGIVVFWLRSDQAAWRDALAQFVGEQLRRQILIEGELRPGFSFTRGLTLKITNLHLANAPGFVPADMLFVPSLEIQVGWQSLFSNRVTINGLTITGATLNLAQNAEGNSNWSFHTEADTRINQVRAEELNSGGRAFILSIQTVTVSDMLVTYTTPAGQDMVQIAKLEILSPQDAFVVKGEFKYDHTPYYVDFTANALLTLRDGLRQPIKLDLQNPLHRLMVEADYSRHDTLHRLDNLEIRADRLALKGEGTVTMAEPHPHVIMQLTTPVLDLPKARIAAANNNTKSEPEPLFSRTPLPWPWLSSLDLDGILEVKRVTRGNEPLGPLHIDAKLAQSRLVAGIVAQPPGAAQPIKIDLHANADQQASLVLDAPALNPTLWSVVMDGKPIVQSPASLSLNLAGRGAALHDLAATAQGTIAFAAQPGALNVAAIPNVARRALDAVLGPEALDEAALACLKAGFTVQDGIMQASGAQAGIGLDSTVIALSGDGQADLGRETIALRLVAAPKLPGLTQTLIPFEITGALNDPRISADLAATAGQVAGQLVGKLAETLPSARIGLAAAKAMGKDPAVMIAQPHNPCIAVAPIAEPAIVPDAATAPSKLPPEVQQKLKGARDLLDQFIKATEPPTPATPVQPAAIP